jgi:hypothetical protein
MTTDPDTPLDPVPPSDVCLLLRAHAHQQWLNREVMPIVSDLKDRDSVPEDEVAAALAYLEVLWFEASLRAAETEAAFAQLDEAGDNAGGAGENGGGGQGLRGQVRRYHEAVRSLHEAVEAHVRELVAAPADMREANPATW